jgi:putative transposase
MSFIGRATGWLTDDFHVQFRELLLHSAAREAVLCPVYCLMPDHIHLVWMGLKSESDQYIGMAFLRSCLKRFLKGARFQKQPFDHVLRDEDRRKGAFAKTCFYVSANPVRAELIREGESWPFLGAVVPGYPTLHPLQPDFWRKFWKCYQSMHDPESAKRRLPRDRTIPTESHQPSS